MPPTLVVKPGVLHAETVGGGVLLDVAADRYVALSVVSGRLWQALAGGADERRLADVVADACGAAPAEAAAVVERQLRLWRRAALIDVAAPGRLPTPRPLPNRPANESWSGARASCGRARLAVLAARLVVVEARYRRALRRRGLAATLIQLQSERASPASDAVAAARATAAAQRLLRRVYAQSQSAVDCLTRSLGLAATLRRRGVVADLCLGVLDPPFKAHAWVEYDGVVLNESIAVRRHYVEIARF